MDTTTDAQFIESFTSCYRAFLERLTRYIRRYVNRRDIAEELAQEVFLRLYERRVSLAGESGRVVALLYTMGRNIAIDHLRRLAAERRKYQLLQASEAALDRDLNRPLEESWVDGQILSTLHDTIDSLPDDERRLYLARHFSSVSGAALAREHGLSEYRIRRIERVMRRRIRERLGPLYAGTKR